MKNSVLIKHEQNGLRIRLDEMTEWNDLLEEVRDKFTSAARFFGDAALPGAASLFEGGPELWPLSPTRSSAKR